MILKEGKERLLRLLETPLGWHEIPVELRRFLFPLKGDGRIAYSEGRYYLVHRVTTKFSSLHHSLLFNLVGLAVDEGMIVALNEAQKIQLGLETIIECGSKSEREMAAGLLTHVNKAIHVINDKELILHLRELDIGDPEDQQQWMDAITEVVEALNLDKGGPENPVG